MSEAMDVQAQELEKLNNLLLMQSLLTNMETNIYLIEQGSVGKTITVSNANLFQLAAQYYGDATKWTAIAQANGLSDPMIEATINLRIASLNVQNIIFSGFVAPQQTISITFKELELLGEPLKTYEYSVSPSDTLFTVTAAMSRLIQNSSYNENILTLPSYSNLSFKVSRFFNLIIPQTAQDTGGILPS
jgi:hypothetical protein